MWVLIIAAAISGELTIKSIEFDSESTCLTALDRMNETVTYGPEYQLTCVKK
jgi:hypothetical protein